jgi:ketol-acid reductoisomerase
MRRILAEIQDGSFAARWIAECENGAPELYGTRAAERHHAIEQVGAQLRAMMTWLPASGQPAEQSDKQPAQVA